VGDSLAVLDLDHFKELNDTAGHAAGDECLRRFAADVRATLRESDYAARLGGDEFLLVLPNAGAGAQAVVERLRRRWGAHERLVGFSAGIAIRQQDEAPTATLKRADEALYLAKRGGRGITSEHGVPEELRDAGRTGKS
jgi:diguanylate cyclase (GGDEF)-like protein